MAFDWEEFVKTGINPAVKMYQDYFTSGMRSQLMNQQYRQDVSKLQVASKMRQQEREQDYALDKMLADVKHEITRAEVLDKDYLDRRRDWEKFGYDTEKERQRQTGKMDLQKLRHQGEAYRYGEMKEIAKIHNGISILESTDPDKVKNLAMSIWNKNATNYLMLDDQINNAQQEIENIDNNMQYKELDKAVRRGEELLSEDATIYNSFNSRYAKLLDTVRKLENAQGETREQLIRFEMDKKMGGIMTHTPEQANFLSRIGCPQPVQGKPPYSRSKQSMDKHIDFIRRCRIYGMAMPRDADLINLGFDAMWIENNWKTYWDYFTQNPSYTMKEQYDVLMNQKKKNNLMKKKGK